MERILETTTKKDVHDVICQLFLSVLAKVKPTYCLHCWQSKWPGRNKLARNRKWPFGVGWTRLPVLHSKDNVHTPPVGENVESSLEQTESSDSTNVCVMTKELLDPMIGTLWLKQAGLNIVMMIQTRHTTHYIFYNKVVNPIIITVFTGAHSKVQRCWRISAICLRPWSPQVDQYSESKRLWSEKVRQVWNICHSWQWLVWGFWSAQLRADIESRIQRMSWFQSVNFYCTGWQKLKVLYTNLRSMAAHTLC